MYDELREIGEIVLLQVQHEQIKSGTYPDEAYAPEKLAAVPQLLLDEKGVFGVTDDGTRLMDVHHPDHAQSRFRGRNGLSIGFTEHYRQMQARLGDHLHLGCAAENIIVATERVMQLPELTPYLLIHHQATDSWIVLEQGMVAAPCLPFARYAARRPLDSKATKAALQFLNNGMRGFYFVPASLPAQPRVAVGDRLFVAERLPQFDNL